MKQEVNLQVRHGLKIINIILIVLLSMGIVFLGIIEYFRIQDGEHNEVATDLEEPYITWSGEELLSIPLIFGIGLLVANKKKKIVTAQIELNKDLITVKYLNKTFTLNVKNIKTIKYDFEEKDKLHMLSFRGTEKMLQKKGNKTSNSFDLIANEDITKLCENITSTTNIKIKNFTEKN